MASRRPRPLDPGAATTRTLPERIARLLLAAEADALEIDKAPFPELVEWSLGGEVLPTADVELAWAEQRLTVVLHGFGWDHNEALMGLAGRMNHRLEMSFADGSVLSERLANFTGHTMRANAQGLARSHIIVVDDWRWIPASHCQFWVTKLAGARVEVGNLILATPSRTSSNHLRVEAHYDVHLVSTRSKQVALVVDTREQVLDLDILANDIAAVEFAIGRPLWIPFLVGVDENGTAQGAGDLSARQVHADQPRCPVPTLRRNGTWPAVLAARVAFKLLEDPREDAPLAIGTAAYMDSLSGHVHARYLLAQVALEAFAGALVDSPAHLVADLSAWRRFVNEHEASIKLLARDRESAEQLIRNLSNNVFRAPSGRRVANALRELELEVPIELLEEVARRGSAAHNFVMYKGEVDIQVLADRIARVQTLLVALIAKHVGYEGPIIGWELENGSWSVPSWWPDGDHAEAHLRFLAQGDSDT